MSNELATINPEIVASLIINGDIARLNNIQRVEYITKLCERIGVDPLTQPFKILKLGGREVLYADKGCAQQLCMVHKISTEIVKKERIEDIYVVTVRAKIGDRFTDEDGAVTIGTMKGDNLANALMKAVTKAKRRAVLALCGLGMLDESELETIKAPKEEVEMPKLKAEAPKIVVPEAQEAQGAVKIEETKVSTPEPVKTSLSTESIEKLMKASKFLGTKLDYILKSMDLPSLDAILTDEVANKVYSQAYKMYKELNKKAGEK